MFTFAIVFLLYRAALIFDRRNVPGCRYPLKKRLPANRQLPKQLLNQLRARKRLNRTERSPAK